MKTLPATLTITVTQRDINVGKAFECHACPIALAARRELRRHGFVNNLVAVGGRIKVKTRRAGTEVGRYNVPSEASQFMATFDHEGPTKVQPFAFTARLLV